MSGAVDVLRVIRSAAFELRTVTTGNEGRVASQLDQVTAALCELIEAGRSLLDGEPDDAAWGRFESALNCVGGAA